jgi:hypothetical protein
VPPLPARRVGSRHSGLKTLLQWVRFELFDTLDKTAAQWATLGEVRRLSTPHGLPCFEKSSPPPPNNSRGPIALGTEPSLVYTFRSFQPSLVQARSNSNLWTKEGADVIIS